MKKRSFTTVTVAIALAALNLAAVPSRAQDPAPSEKTLLQIVQQLEQGGYGPFTEISMDDGYWEVEVNRDGVAYELTVDLKTGEVLGEHRDDREQLPPENAMPLSQLLQKLCDDKGFCVVDEVSFERRYWEIEVFQDRQKREIHVDPITAEVIANRVDD